MRENELPRAWVVLALATIQAVLPAHCQIPKDFLITGAQEVWALAAQPDGKTLFGGHFDQLGGRTLQNLARVNADGSLDTSFRPRGIGVVTALAVQADGKILVGAEVTNLAGQVSILARLNPDGSPDGTSLSGGPDDFVDAIAVQPDGKILVGGPFKSLAGHAREYVARLNADGTLDDTFNPAMDASPYSIVVQPDGKILLSGGGFSSLDGQPRNGLGRLNGNGTLDSSFSPALANPWSMALQGDGKILLSFLGRVVPGLTNTVTTRLNADGTMDTNFNSELRTRVDSFAVQSDGKILAAAWDSGLHRLNQDGSLDPSFNSRTNSPGVSLGLQADGQMLVAAGRIYGLTNTEVASESLSYQGTAVTWLRGGTSPEVWSTVFEYSTNGTDWNRLGSGVRISGGWQLSGVTLPSGYTLRALGGVAGGYLNDSFWFASSYSGRPVLTAQPNSQTNYAGRPGSLAVSAGGTEPLAYQWLRDGVLVSGATDNTLHLLSAQPTDAGEYSVVVSNQFGSVTSSVAAVTVLLPPEILVNDGHFGFTNGQFGFNIAGPIGQTIAIDWTGVVDWSPMFGNWVSLQTNLLSNSPYYFSEPRSTKYPRRFYRVRVVQDQ